MSSPKPLPESIWQTVARLTQDRRAWLVGGAVRDHLLQRVTCDADFAVEGDALGLARKVADRLGGEYYPLDRQRGTGRVLVDRGTPEAWILDFAVLRGPTIEDDLRSRDFTVNALAIDLAQPERMIDPTGGVGDLRAGILRGCSERAIADDPVRSLRAVRIAADLALHIHPATLHQVEAAVGTLQNVSAERVRDELFRVLGGQNPAGTIRTLAHLGLLAVVLPEVTALRGVQQSPPHAYDAFEHSLAVLENLTQVMDVLGQSHDAEAASRMTLAEVSLKLGRFRKELSAHLNASLVPGRDMRALLSLAALFHDVGKAFTGSVAEDGRIRFPGHEEASADLMRWRAGELRLSARETAMLVTVVRYHDLPAVLDRAGAPDRRAIYRYFDQTGESGIDVGLLSLADRLGMYLPPIPQDVWRRRVDVVRALLEAWFEADWLRPPRLLSGEDLGDALGIGPGPQLGRLLKALREAQAVGEISTREQAIALARRLRDESASLPDAFGRGLPPAKG
jgi:tRNA nucleotidyltransferase/poly(A) polymerase